MIRSDHLMSRDLGSCIFQEGGFCLQRFRLSASPEIVAAREDFFNHGWTRINTDEDRLSLIRVHPCSSVVGTYWLRLCRAAGNPWLIQESLCVVGGSVTSHEICVHLRPSAVELGASP